MYLVQNRRDSVALRDAERELLDNPTPVERRRRLQLHELLEQDDTAELDLQVLRQEYCVRRGQGSTPGTPLSEVVLASSRGRPEDQLYKPHISAFRNVLVVFSNERVAKIKLLDLPLRRTLLKTVFKDQD